MWNGIFGTIPAADKNNVEKQYLYTNQFGCSPLIGRMNSSLVPAHQLRSFHVDDDCYFKPHLCDNGFSIGFTVQSKFSLSICTISL